ncbi:MAG: ribonuclease G [Gammaproteobacteria bacterium]
MSEEILINVTPQETRVAIVENGVLQEIQVERVSKQGLVGHIYKGCVSRVMPGMDAAFVDIGLSKAAFIHSSDVAFLPKSSRGQQTDVSQPDETILQSINDNITSLLHEGQQLLVQVVKDQLGTKGARLTTNITLPSRYMVLLPYSHDVRLSTRIEDEDERVRLTTTTRKFVEELDANCGCILRTAAEGVGETELRRDLKFLLNLWSTIVEKVNKVSSVDEVYSDLPLAVRTLRDLSVDDIEIIRIDSRTTFDTVKEFSEKLVPELSDCVTRYSGSRPIFDLYSIEDELQKALHRKVTLKSGGYLIFDQTEAMTTIDINTGGYVGHRNLEETIYKTNLEAAQAIARQLRLRNLGGIIIIDFIDMEDEEHKRQVIRVFEKSLDKDRAKSQVCEVSPLGLVEMTRKRTRESLEHVLCEPCITCSGRGYIKTAETVCFELFREIMREARQYETNELLVLASQPVVDLLLDEESTSLAELEDYMGKTIKLQVESLYLQEQFDVVPL